MQIDNNNSSSKLPWEAQGSIPSKTVGVFFWLWGFSPDFKASGGMKSRHHFDAIGVTKVGKRSTSFWGKAMQVGMCDGLTIFIENLASGSG